MRVLQKPDCRIACGTVAAVAVLSMACSTRLGARATYSHGVMRAVQHTIKDALQHAAAAQQDADPLVALHNATVASTLVSAALRMMPWQDVDSVTSTDVLALERVIDDAYDAALRAVKARCAA